MEFTTERDFFSFTEQIKNRTSHDKIMYINIFVDSEDGDLKRLYLSAAENHNNKILTDPHFYDAGFDLYLPKNEKDEDIWGDGTRFFGRHWVDVPINKVDFKVKCSAKMYSYNNGTASSYFTPFYTYARSSISKTPLRLANNQGIIDAGYRGNLIGMFDCLVSSDEVVSSEYDWHMEKYSRLLQICAPGLVPIYVNIVNTLEELGPSTSRGEGGFGSTGK
jgi:dUTP pyrophosphatase